MKEIVFWENIKKKYTRSYELYLDWLYHNNLNKDIRNLYDFFDSKHLKAFVYPGMTNIRVFEYFIINGKSKHYHEDVTLFESDISVCNKRIHAEMEVFMEAFKILENK